MSALNLDELIDISVEPNDDFVAYILSFGWLDDPCPSNRLRGTIPVDHARALARRMHEAASIMEAAANQADRRKYSIPIPVTLRAA